MEDTELLPSCADLTITIFHYRRPSGSRVLSRGNETYDRERRRADQDAFSQLIQTLKASIKGGLPATPDLIIALHAELTPLGSPEAGAGDQKASCDDFFDACVQIPGSNQTIYPRSKGQGLYLKGMAMHDLSFAVGPAGTGKTYLAMAWALKDLLGKAKRKLILTRPIVEAGESLGYLPGDLVQKINPYLRPLYDAMEMLIPYESIRRLEETRSIEVAPLAYMRGRSLNNCVVILDEAQNTTKEQMKMFLTRLGENTKAIVTGDITQIDLPRKAESGLVHALQILSSIEGIFISHLDSRDVVRSRLVRKIIEAYENE